MEAIHPHSKRPILHLRLPTPTYVHVSACLILLYCILIRIRLYKDSTENKICTRTLNPKPSTLNPPFVPEPNLLLRAVDGQPGKCRTRSRSWGTQTPRGRGLSRLGVLGLGLRI